MVYKKKKTNYKKRYVKKRKFYRKRKFIKAAKKNTVVKSLAFDKEVYVKFKIVNVGFKMTQATQSIPYYVAYRLNSLYDPYYATGGSQPTGYDQWCAFYGKYMVMAVSYKITFQNTSNYPLICACQIDLTGASYTNNDDLCNAKKVYSKIINPANSGFGNSCSLKGYSKIKNLVGINQLDEYQDGSTISNNPLRLCNLNIYISSADGAQIGVSYMQVKIKYYAKMYQINPLSQS